MDDLISRQAAIDNMARVIWGYPNEIYPQLNDYSMALALAKDGLMGVPSAQQWIPCSERLPKRKDETQMRGYYLTTNAYGSVGLTKYEFEGGGLGYAWDSYIRIVAWMPLPEPYKGEKNET